MKKNLKRHFFKKWLFKKMLWVDVLFDQDLIFLIGSMSSIYELCTPPNVLKKGGGSSNVHIVLKGSHQNVHVCSQGGGGV